MSFCISIFHPHHFAALVPPDDFLGLHSPVLHPSCVFLFKLWDQFIINMKILDVVIRLAFEQEVIFHPSLLLLSLTFWMKFHLHFHVTSTSLRCSWTPDDFLGLHSPFLHLSCVFLDFGCCRPCCHPSCLLFLDNDENKLCVLRRTRRSELGRDGCSDAIQSISWRKKNRHSSASRRLFFLNVFFLHLSCIFSPFFSGH